ncbi:MAG: phenylacetate--CoA ligase family protein [Gemmataceae bacterium]|nr:phenylacetate--CoA ligase family protein [Gemmataceae bacterium]
MPETKKPNPLVFSFWEQVLSQNTFYQSKLEVPRNNLSDWLGNHFFDLPFTTKKDLQEDQEDHPPYGKFHYSPPGFYCRMHQTSGSTGKPLVFLDTQVGWNWMLGNWKYIFRTAGLKPSDRLFFPFSFGPFLGFWTAFEAAGQSGYFTLPGGGLSSEARVASIQKHAITVLLCTPSYALKLGEVAEQKGINLRSIPLRKIILAGEPGASIPATRSRIERHWGKIVVDHHGMTETGPVSVECPNHPMLLHLIPDAFFAEIIDPVSSKPLEPSAMGELVLTSLGRVGSAVFRYRTGDLVQGEFGNCDCGFSGQSLKGGILGRTDEMIFIKGNNFFPSAIQGFLHEFPEINEYRAVYWKEKGGELVLEIELAETEVQSLAAGISAKFKERFHFTAEVKVVSPGTLPRAEHKAKRFQVFSKKEG